jgi:arginine deiminase
MSDQSLGVYSQTGPLRQVVVCKPGRAHRWLTADNCKSLIFDDVMWVNQACKDHDVFVELMRGEGVEVHDTGELLADILEKPQARKWVLDQRITPTEVGVGMLGDLRGWLDELPGAMLADYLMGGLVVDDLPFAPKGMFGAFHGGLGFILPPLPNAMFSRDNSAWIYSGVTLNPMCLQARRPETLLTAAIYRFHPEFAGRIDVLWGDPSRDHGLATLEGGDVMTLGDGLVLIGMGARTSPQGVGLLAEALFDQGRATRVLVCKLPQSVTHLDEVLTFCSGDVVTGRRDVLSAMTVYDLHPGEGRAPLDIRHANQPFVEVLARALNIKALKIVGGALRKQWNDGANMLALRPGVVIGFDRNEDTNAALRAEGMTVLEIPGGELGRGGGGPRCLSCPTIRNPA